MLKKVLSSQLRINMVSGFAMTVVNTAVILAAYSIYLHFPGHEKYGVRLVLATVLTQLVCLSWRRTLIVC